MHCSNSGLLRERVGHLLVALLVTHSLKVATATSVSLTVKQPKSVFEDVVIVDSAKYHLIAILNCTGTQLQANVNKEESLLYGNGSLEVQLERGSKPNEYFLLPNNSGKTLPEGEYQVDVLCSIPCAQETKSIMVSVVTSATATDSKVPYFIDSPRTVNISSSTPPGSIVTYFKAEVYMCNCADVRTYVAVAIVSVEQRSLLDCVSNAYLHDLYSPVPRGPTIWKKGLCCPRRFLTCTFPDWLIWGSCFGAVLTSGRHTAQIWHCHYGRSRTPWSLDIDNHHHKWDDDFVYILIVCIHTHNNYVSSGTSLDL